MKLKNFFLGLMLFVVGLVMVIAPTKIYQFIIIILGAAAIVNGFYDIIYTYKLSKDELFKKTVLIKSILSLTVGFISVVLPFVMAAAINTVIRVLTFVLAVSIIFFAIGSFITASKMTEKNEKRRFNMEGMIHIVLAVVLLVLGSNLVKMFITVIGIIAMIAGSILLLVQILSMRREKLEQAEVVDVRDEEDDDNESPVLDVSDETEEDSDDDQSVEESSEPENEEDESEEVVISGDIVVTDAPEDDDSEDKSKE